MKDIFHRKKRKESHIQFFFDYLNSTFLGELVLAYMVQLSVKPPTSILYTGLFMVNANAIIYKKIEMQSKW